MKELEKIFEHKEIHKTQNKLLSLLRLHQDAPLTYRQLQESLGVSSTSTVFHHVIQLEKKGFLKRLSRNPKKYKLLTNEKTIRVLVKEWDKLESERDEWRARSDCFEDNLAEKNEELQTLKDEAIIIYPDGGKEYACWRVYKDDDDKGCFGDDNLIEELKTLLAEI